MKIEGVIFDFNGTLYWDTKLQNISWDMFLDKYGFRLSDKEKQTIIHGINASDSFSHIFSKTLSNDEVEYYTNEKEIIYRDLCRKTDMKLADGTVDFIEYLKVRNIAYTIATASGYDNVCFFFEQFKLGRYFDRNKIIYNNGKIKGKPHPEIFLKAVESLHVDNDKTLVFEDSLAGIKSAENAGIGKIIIVDSNDDDYGSLKYQKIKSFREVDKTIFD